MTIKFSLIGASGYIGRRHIKVIKNIGGILNSYLDLQRSDEIDSHSKYFDNSHDFFQDILTRKPDYCVVCSPNHLHVEHIIKSLQCGVDVISEKPLFISIKDLQLLEDISYSFDKEIYGIMQLRNHPVFEELVKIKSDMQNKKQAEIIVITPRDESYLSSWKVDPNKSGGILFNLGIHYFDLLIEVFGQPINTVIESYSKLSAKGVSVFNELEVKWFFSIDPADQTLDNNPIRSFKIDDSELRFDNVPDDLHEVNYKEIIKGSHKFKLRNLVRSHEYIARINENKLFQT